MKKAGDYSDRVQRLEYSENQNPDNGDPEKVFTAAGYLWASVEPISGRRGKVYGGEQTGADALIRVRGYPAITALDRLYRPEWDETYEIDSIYIGDNETILTAFKYDVPQDD